MYMLVIKLTKIGAQVHVSAGSIPPKIPNSDRVQAMPLLYTKLTTQVHVHVHVSKTILPYKP